jgi:hypothetical protein
MQVANDTGNSANPAFIQMHDYGCEFANLQCIDLLAGQDIHFTQPILQQAGNGLYVPGTPSDNAFVANGVNTVTFEGGRAENAGKWNYEIAGQGVKITGESILNGNYSYPGTATGVYGGVVLDATSAGVVVADNFIGLAYSAGWAQDYPVQANSGAANFAITGNVFLGNTHDYENNLAGYSATQRFSGNSSLYPITIASGFGSGAGLSESAGYEAFDVNVGTGGTASSGVITLPLAANQWNCLASDLTTPSNNTRTYPTSTTSVTISGYNAAGVSTPWGANDVIGIQCHPM